MKATEGGDDASSLIYLGSSATAKQAGSEAPKPELNQEDRVKQMGDLSAAERKQLRLARFGGGGKGVPGLQEAATTIEALEMMEE